MGDSPKPAHEPIVVARKPLIGTVATNVLKYGTGAINIEGCRVEPTGESKERVNEPSQERRYIDAGSTNFALTPACRGGNALGRWPANVIHDGSHDVRAVFPESNDKSAARFFYCAKANKKDRGEGNIHPTVKPLELMRYLCRLVTPPKGGILDPFMGSGSTGRAALLERFDFLGIEKNPEYFAIAEKRVKDAL